MAGYRFRFRPGPAAAALTGIFVTAALGNWQLDRAHEKHALQAQLDERRREPAVSLPSIAVDAEQYRFRKVEVEGRFEPAYTIFLDNKVYRGVPGYHVITPQRIGDSRKYVLVNRGWLPAGPRRGELPVVPTPTEPVTVLGTAVVPSAKVVELSDRTVEGRVWQNLVLARYRERVPLDIQPIVVQQESDSGDGLVRDWPRPDAREATHWGYAFQWFALSATILIIYLVLNVKRIPGPAQPD